MLIHSAHEQPRLYGGIYKRLENFAFDVILLKKYKEKYHEL